MSASIFNDFLSAIKGAAIYKRASFLLDQIDQHIFPDFINITEEPHLPDGMGSSPYDAEGVLTKNKDIVRNGKLKTYLLDTYSAKKLNSTSTSNKGLVTNIVIDKEGDNIFETMTDSFDLYVDIAKNACNGIPHELIRDDIFKKYRIKKKVFPKRDYYCMD